MWLDRQAPIPVVSRVSFKPKLKTRVSASYLKTLCNFNLIIHCLDELKTLVLNSDLEEAFGLKLEFKIKL